TSEFSRKAKLLAEEAGAAGREVVPTWAGIVLVGEDERDAERLLERRRSRGMPDEGLWCGPADRFASFLTTLEEAGAGWAAVVPAGPADRVDVLAKLVLPALSR